MKPTTRPRPFLHPAIDRLRRRWYQVPLIYDAHYANGNEGRRSRSLHGHAIALLRRLFPHDTLHIGGKPYMHRWYVWGYAPTPDDPDAAMVCATCKVELTNAPTLMGDDPTFWRHGIPGMYDHDAVPVSAPRAGWRWQDHGVGAFRIHCTVASDDSRAFHDHPWDFASIIVRGAYVETRPTVVLYGDPEQPERVTWCPAVDAELPSDMTERTLYRAPAINRKRATDLHVLEVDDGPVWSLFFTRPKVRSWGFAGPFGWLGWRTFDAEYPERDAYTEQGGDTFRRETLGEWPTITVDPELPPGTVELRHDDGTVVGRITGVGE